MSGQGPDGSGLLGGDSSNGSTDDSGAFSDDPNSWWWSASAEAVKWAVIAGIFIIFFVCLMAAYYHAKHRMKNGLQPLPYHRWLVRRQQRIQFVPRDQNNFSFYGHNMQPYGNAPPPAYNAESDYVPPYTPPAEGSKIRMKGETTLNTTEGGPSHPPPVANPARPVYS